MSTDTPTVDAFAKRWGLVRSNAKHCPYRLQFKNCKPGWHTGCWDHHFDFYLAEWADHGRLWRRSGKPRQRVFQGQPYPKELFGSLAAFCERFGLQYTVSGDPELCWHYPGAVVSVFIWDSFWWQPPEGMFRPEWLLYSDEDVLNFNRE